MRSTVNVGHREPSLPVSDRPHHRCSGGFEKPGALAPAGAPMAHTETTQPAGEWKGSGSPGLGHTAPRVSPPLRCGRPIRQSSFLSLPNIMHPPLLRSSLGPPGPVSRTSAVSGADGRGACGRTTCSHGSPLPPLPPGGCRPQPPAAHRARHVPPSVHGAAGIV